MSSSDAAAEFWRAINDHDVAAAFGAVAQDATVTLPAVGVQGRAHGEGREFFEATVAAFPDVRFAPRRRFTGTDGTVVTEAKMEGTQAGDYLGVTNQEKHVDVDQVWLLGTADGRIVSITGFWDQNQLYRRLAVKRLDHVALV